MSAVAFDTLTAARDLEAAGIKRRQAEAIAGTVRTAAAADREALATKADLAELRADTKADLAELRGAEEKWTNRILFRHRKRCLAPGMNSTIPEEAPL